MMKRSPACWFSFFIASQCSSVFGVFTLWATAPEGRRLRPWNATHRPQKQTLNLNPEP
jgi:hypothetical protein